MVALKKYDLAGSEVGVVNIDDALLEVRAHPQSVKDYIVAIRNNARQWSACTKTRAEINRTGKKPHPQKGGGRSRQGDLAAPQYKGGGIVFGPRPKFDMHTRINRKERRAAIRALIADKVRENRVYVLQASSMEEPETKRVAAFFNKTEIGSKRTLVLGSSLRAQSGNGDSHFVKSLRNLQKKEYLPLPQVNGYELAKCHDLVVLESALGEFLSILGVNHG